MRTRATLAQRSVRAVVAMALAIVAVVASIALSVARADAHAQLTSAEPAPGSTLTSPPAFVVLHFNEDVSANLGSIQVFDTDRTRVDAGGATSVPGDSRALRLALPSLPAGAYVVSWRAVSADSHPVRGAFTFRIGTGSAADPSTVSAVLRAGQGSRAVGVVYGAVRSALFAALAVVIGGGLFIGVLWPQGRRSGVARRLWWAGWAVAVGSTGATIGLQGLYGAGLPLRDVGHWSVWSDVLGTRYGLCASLRLALLGVTALLVVAAAQTGAFRHDRGAKRAEMAIGAAVAIGLAATVSFAGHAATGRWPLLGLSADVGHVLAASIWLGGLGVAAAVALGPRRRPEASLDAVVGAMDRFSVTAVAAVATIVASGIAQSLRQLGGPDGLHTAYGKLLITKVVLVAVILEIAVTARLVLRRQLSSAVAAAADGPGPEPVALAPPLARLRRRTGAEAGLGLAVLIVTALLVNTAPARDTISKPFSAELTAGDVLVDLTVDPAHRGPAEVHVYVLSANGEPRDVPNVTMQLALPAADLGPLDVPVQRVALGHYVAEGFDIPIAGRWTATVTVRTDDVTEVSAHTTLNVR